MRRASLLVMFAACAGDGDNANEGRFSLAWQVTDNGAVIECASAGIETIDVVTDNGVVTTETFFCTDEMAITGPRDIGPYTITVRGLDDIDNVVAQASDQGSVVGASTVDLGVFPLEIALEVCDASSCATGCCDDQGACIDPQSDLACGRGGATCVDCTAIAQGCNTTDGVCVK